MNISKIEGIGPAYSAKLNQVGINTIERLLFAAANRKGRQDLAEKTSLSEKLILEWVNRADLMRVKGVGEEYSDLLEAAGVDTVKELALRRPENLLQAILEINNKKRLVRRVPRLAEVRSWVDQAKSMPAVITY